MDKKAKIKFYQKEILINQDLINDLKHIQKIDKLMKIMILITILAINLSIFILTKPLSLVMPPLLGILMVMEITGKIILTGGTGSQKQKRQEIAFYQDQIKNYEEQIQILQSEINKEKRANRNINNDYKQFPNLSRHLVRKKSK